MEPMLRYCIAVHVYPWIKRFLLARFSSKKLGVSVCISTCLIKVDRFVQVMATRPRSDIYINLPALEKLDAMLIVRSDPNCYSIDLAWHDLSQK